MKHFIALIAIVGLFFECPEPANAVEEDNIQFKNAGVIDPNPSTYLYAGKVIYDSVEGLFKYWGCGGVAGDFIIYKEAAVFEDLDDAPWVWSLGPSTNPNAFDHNQTCDPTVVEHNGLYYLSYTGLRHADSPQTSRIGAAISYNRGRSWERLFGGQPIIQPTNPGIYGAGQSSVARGPDGLFYMLYTDQLYSGGSPAYTNIVFVRSPIPSFPNGFRETIVSRVASMFYGVSLELDYNRGRGRFEVISNWPPSNDPNYQTAQVRMIHVDDSFAATGYTDYTTTQGFRFGEGIALITNTLGEIMPFSEPGKMHLNFVATTLGPTNRGFNFIVTGPVKYTRFSEGHNGVLTNFSDIGDRSFSGDLDGDSLRDILILTPSTYVWKWKLSSEGFSTVHTVQWGLSGDIPLVTRDWNKDGKDERAVFRPSEGKFYIHYSGNWPNSVYQVVTWGLSGDVPMSGDTNGNGDGELITWRPSTGTWHVLYSGSWPNVVSSSRQYGLNGDDPFLYDLNNNGTDDFIIWRPGSQQALVYSN